MKVLIATPQRQKSTQTPEPARDVCFGRGIEYLLTMENLSGVLGLVMTLSDGLLLPDTISFGAAVKFGDLKKEERASRVRRMYDVATVEQYARSCGYDNPMAHQIDLIICAPESYRMEPELTELASKVRSVEWVDAMPVNSVVQRIDAALSNCWRRAC